MRERTSPGTSANRNRHQLVQGVGRGRRRIGAEQRAQDANRGHGDVAAGGRGGLRERQVALIGDGLERAEDGDAGGRARGAGVGVVRLVDGAGADDGEAGDGRLTRDLVRAGEGVDEGGDFRGGGGLDHHAGGWT
jgi:hypothetical protein